MTIRLEAATPGTAAQPLAIIELRPVESFQAMERTFVSYSLYKNGHAIGTVTHVANDGPVKLAFRALAELLIDGGTP